MLVSSILAYPDISYADGAALTKVAFSKIPYVGAPLLTFGILTFAFSTILGWSYYGESAVNYIEHQHINRFYRLLYIIALFFGSIITVLIVVTVTTVWDILGAALGALFPSARLNLTIGIICCLTMMTLAIPFFLFWESAAWMQYTSNYIFGPGWLILIAVFAGTQVLAWFVLKRACACKE